MGRRDTVVAWLLPLVLILVASHQVWLANTRALSSWKGGGFGMFATVDPSTFRAVRGTFDTTDGPVPFDVYALEEQGAAARKVFVNARALPDERRLAPLADLVTRSRWRLVGDVAEHQELLDEATAGPILEVGPRRDTDAVTVTGGRLEVWRVRYDRRTQTMEPERVGSHVFSVEPPSAAPGRHAADPTGHGPPAPGGGRGG
jgi:hypothetical protein